MAVDFSRVNRNSAMGATVWPDGTAFRTWAPTAERVYVVTGNALAETNNPSWHPGPEYALASLGDATWGGFLAGVKSGAPYMFYIEGIGSCGWKRDPYARELTLSPAFPDNHCVVRDPRAYVWRDTVWQTPRFDDLIIYQLHVGTF
jgi:1,4-alpha-glucan branching enzyme